MSSLAPWIAVGRNAPMLLTNDAGTDASAVVAAALARPELAQVDRLVIAATPTAIPPDKRPNPIAGKDAFIEMEPGTPNGHDPFTLARLSGGSVLW